MFDASKRLLGAFALEARSDTVSLAFRQDVLPSFTLGKLQDPVDCACFLNAEGDLVAGVKDKLVVIRASVYRAVEDYEKARERSSVVPASTSSRPHISDSPMRFKGG